MIKFGYEHGKGLGARLQGIAELINPCSQMTTFGLGYNYSAQEYLDWEPPREGYYYPLPKSIPPLFQTFRSVGFMNIVTDDLLESMKGLSLTEAGDKSCNIVMNEEGWIGHLEMM